MLSPPHFISSFLPTVMGSTFEAHDDSINGNENELPITHTVGECNNLSLNLTCPICMDAWVNRGEHHICCLPCGHIYGMSCIKRWLQRNHGSGKCPQCIETCSLKDVRRLYATVVAADDEKRIASLEAKIASFDQLIKSIEHRQGRLEENLKVLGGLQIKSIEDLQDTLLEESLRKQEHELRDLRVFCSEQIERDVEYRLRKMLDIFGIFVLFVCIVHVVMLWLLW